MILYLALLSGVMTLVSSEMTFARLSSNYPETLGSCGFKTAYGNTTKCCNGAELDGGGHAYDGQCAEATMNCAANQLWLWAPTNRDIEIDAGKGRCYNPGGCNWTKIEYNYGCCSCPQGMSVVRPFAGCIPGTTRDCVGCTDKHDRLNARKDDNGDLQYSCIKPGCPNPDGKTTDYLKGAKCTPCGPLASSNGTNLRTPWADMAITGCIPTCNSLDYKTWNKTDVRVGRQGSCPDSIKDYPMTSPDSRICNPQPGDCKMNGPGLALLKSFEKVCPTTYTLRGDDTIGWGHDCKVNAENCATKFHPPIDLEDAYWQLGQDLAKITDYIQKKANFPYSNYLNGNQLAALMDFGFNSGTGSMHKYFSALVNADLQRNATTFCTQFKNVLVNITDPNRRQARYDLCMNSVRSAGCYPE